MYNVAIVTGAATGIGHAIAATMAQRGARVVVDYVGDASAATALVNDIENFGGRALAVEANVTKSDDVQRLDRPTCNPRLAPDWRWMGVRRLRYRGAYVSWFVVRMPQLVMYADFRFDGSLEYNAYDEEVTDSFLSGLNDDVTAIALRREDEVVIFVGNTADRSVMAPLAFKRELRGSFTVRSFSSMRMEWVELGRFTGKTLQNGLAVQIDRKGFCVFELRRHFEGA